MWAGKCCLVGTAASLAATFVRRTAQKTAPGKPRLALWWPVLLLFTTLPLVFNAQNEMLSRACYAGVLLWLANFKLLLLALGRGPLVDPSLTPGQFRALLLLPVLHKEDVSGMAERLPYKPDSPQLWQAAWQRLLGRLPENLIICMVAGYTLTASWVPLFFKTYSGAFGVHAFCALWCDACAALVIWRHGLAMAPTWDRPWLQNSLSDFWSRRWNLAAAYTLRSLIFEPIVEGRAVRKVKKDSEAAAHPTSSDTAAARGARGASAPAGEDITATTTSTQPPSKAATIAAEPAGDAQTIATNGHGVAGAVDAAAQKLGAAAKEATAAVVDVAKQARSSAASTMEAVRQGKRPRVPASKRLLAITLTFAVSGLMHEILLLVCTGWAAYRPSMGKQLPYFLLQVPASLVEQQLSRAFKRAKWTPPDAIAIPFTSLSLQVPGLFLFWNPIFNAAAAAMQH